MHSSYAPTSHPTPSHSTPLQHITELIIGHVPRKISPVCLMVMSSVSSTHCQQEIFREETLGLVWLQPWILLAWKEPCCHIHPWTKISWLVPVDLWGIELWIYAGQESITTGPVVIVTQLDLYTLAYLYRFVEFIELWILLGDLQDVEEL